MSVNKYSKHLAILSAAILMTLSHSAFAETVSMNLPQAMERAFGTNPAISIADYELQSAKASYDAARQNHYLTVTGSHSSGRGGYNYNLYDSTGLYSKHINNTHTNALTASVPIYTGGQLKGATMRAKANYKSALVGKQAAYNDMRSTVTNGYFTVLQRDNLQKLGQESVDRLADHLKNVQAQYDVGVVAKVDVLRSEVELNDAEQSLTQAQNAYELAVSQMDKIVGLPLDTKLQLENILVYNPYDHDLPYCLQYASDHRPELEQAKQKVKAAEGSLVAARSGYQPQVTGHATQNLGKNDNWPGDGRNNWSVGVSVSMNIFDSGVTYSKIHGAKADLEAAKEEYRDTVDSLNLEVRSNYLNMREAEKRIKTTEVAVEQAEEDYRIAQLRYANGVGTNTDVMDASVALTQAKDNYLQALYDYNTSKTDLETSMGVPMLNPVQVIAPVKGEKAEAKAE